MWKEPLVHEAVYDFYDFVSNTSFYFMAIIYEYGLFLRSSTKLTPNYVQLSFPFLKDYGSVFI